MTKTLYLDGFQYVVIEVREARVLVHHAVYEFGELQQESFTVREAIRSQRLDEMHHVWDNLGQWEKDTEDTLEPKRALSSLRRILMSED